MRSAGVLVVGDSSDDPRGLVRDLPGALRELGCPEVVSMGPGQARDGRAALARPPSSPDGAADRIAVVGVGGGGDAAARIAARDGRVAALVLADSPSAPAALELLARCSDLPLLAVADPADRLSLGAATTAHLASTHPDADLRVAAPDQGASADGIARWVWDRLATGARREVTMVASDGWELRGDLLLPEAEDGAPAPGVVLLHSGFADSAIYVGLAERLVRRGLAVLNVDWRGRGRSKGRGDYFELAPEERARAGLDAAAAFDVLAGLPGVDSRRLGAVGIAHGAEHAVSGALGDPRVRALVLLTGYRIGGDAQHEYLTGGDVEVLYVTGEAHRAIAEPMHALAAASPGRATRVVEYPGGAIGYQLFELHDDLEPMIVSWLGEVLSPSGGQRTPPSTRSSAPVVKLDASEAK